MNKSHALAAAALLSLLAFQPAMAQDATSSASSAVSSALSSEPAGETNYGNLISSLQAGGSVDIAGVTDVSTVNYVTLSTIKPNGNTKALENALKKNASAVTKLRADIKANAALAAALTAAGYDVEAVVGAVVAADGSLTVVVDDQA